MERDHKTQEFGPFDIPAYFIGFEPFDIPAFFIGFEPFDIPAFFIGFDLTFLLKNFVSKNCHRIIDPSELYYDENQKTIKLELRKTTLDLSYDSKSSTNGRNSNYTM